MRLESYDAFASDRLWDSWPCDIALRAREGVAGRRSPSSYVMSWLRLTSGHLIS